MENNFHVFRKSTKLGIQNHFVFLDSESEITQVSDKKQLLTFKLACVIFWDKEKDSIYEKTYFDVSEFWDDIDKYFNSGIDDLIFYAHNTQFDFKMMDGFNQLFQRDWELTNHYCKGKVFMLQFKRDNKILRIWDTMNYNSSKPVSVAEIGESLGIPKLEVDFNNVSDKELEIYCKRDTEIIYLYVRKLVEFLESNKLSKLKATAGSLSFNTFRHKFYKPEIESRKICIHDWKRAIKLERESYKGGITDCFKLGTYKGLYKMDINSMYPSVMKGTLLPTKLLFYSHDSDYNQEQLYTIYSNSLNERYGVILKATVTLDKKHAYILDDFGLGKTTFAYGSFETVVCTPEIRFIEKYGSIDYIHEISVYAMETIFDEFVDFFYSKRLEYKKEGNKINEQFCKLMLNTQYGKWGQRNIIYKELDLNDEFLIEYQDIILDMIEKYKENNPDFEPLKEMAYLGTIINTGEIYLVCGKIFFLKQTTNNAPDSFVAIASFITSHSRMMLVDYILKAKRENVYYSDTDSLVVNDRGFINLWHNNCINKYQLGKLKCEGFGDASFFAPKFYDFDDDRKMKGIPKKNSILLNETDELVEYQIEVWQKFKADLKSNQLNSQLITTTTKILKKLYTKGKTDDNNNVIPFSISEIENIIGVTTNK